jgi:uncharacterized protein
VIVTVYALLISHISDHAHVAKRKLAPNPELGRVLKDAMKSHPELKTQAALGRKAGVSQQKAMTTSATTLEPAVTSAVREFARRLAGRYPVLRVILFGSRARGTQRTDSDADIAVLLRGIRGRFLDTKLEMVDIAYDVLLDTGIHIQPLPIWENEWEHPETHSNPRLLQNIEREGIPL